MIYWRREIILFKKGWVVGGTEGKSSRSATDPGMGRVD